MTTDQMNLDRVSSVCDHAMETIRTLVLPRIPAGFDVGGVVFVLARSKDSAGRHVLKALAPHLRKRQFVLVIISRAKAADLKRHLGPGTDTTLPELPRRPPPGSVELIVTHGAALEVVERSLESGDGAGPLNDCAIHVDLSTQWSL